jgi:hypothetical protein
MTPKNKMFLVFNFAVVLFAAVIFLSLFSAGFGAPYGWVNYAVKIEAVLSIALLAGLAVFLVKKK